MAKRIILSAVITLALALTPSLAFSVPTKSVKKKSSSKTHGKTHARVSKKSKTHKRSKYSRRRSRSSRAHYVESSMVPSYRHRYAGSSIGETPPLMKVTPQRDGGFLLEPLTPKKKKTPLMRPSSKPIDQGKDLSAAPREQKYNHFEPWNFSDLILAQAEYYKHTPYCRGASLATGNATDCSGFVQYIYHRFKINLPRSSAEQAQVGKTVTRQMDFSKLLPGDLLFFRRGGHHVGHAGIYLGDGKMIHASSYRTGVTVTNLRQGYYGNTFVVAKRVFVVKYQH
jgi:hypothetical protein